MAIVSPIPPRRLIEAKSLHVVATLLEGDKWTLSEVILKELSYLLVDLGRFAGYLSRH
jgi:hypothetical protein